jgi:hypothetical protein
MTRFPLRVEIDGLNLRAARFKRSEGKNLDFSTLSVLSLCRYTLGVVGGAGAERSACLLDTLWVYHHNGIVKLSHSPVKPCLFVRSSRRELKALPEGVRGRIGHALYQAQCGQERLG